MKRYEVFIGSVVGAVAGKLLGGGGGESSSTTVVQPQQPDYISPSTPKMPSPPSYGGFSSSTSRTGKQAEKGGLKSVGGDPSSATLSMWVNMYNNARARSSISQFEDI